MFAFLKRIRRFACEDMWAEELATMPRHRAWPTGAYRVVWHAVRNFDRNLGNIRAAGLSLTTLLALVPLVAIAVGVAEVLGYGEELESALLRETVDWPPRLQEVVAGVKELVAGTSFGALGAFGTAILAWTVLRLYRDTEAALNAIFGVRNRPFWLNLSTFLLLLIALPPLVLAALFLKSMLQNPWFLQHAWDWVRVVYSTGFEFVPFALVWLAFTLLYKFMPRARVGYVPALVGGISAGSAWLLLFSVYLQFQVGVSVNNAIYGTLAALPLLVVYLQLSWTVLLYGAEITCGVQNIHSLRPSGIVAKQP